MRILYRPPALMDREHYNEYMRVYNLGRYYGRKQLAIELLGGKCRQCGSTKRLEFDHINPKRKDFVIGKMWSAAFELFYSELQRCQLLCHDCHWAKTLQEMGRVSAKTNHGTISSCRYCRCESCRKAKRDYMRRFRLRKRMCRPTVGQQPFKLSRKRIAGSIPATSTAF